MGYTIFHADELEWHPRREGDPRLVAELSPAMTEARANLYRYPPGSVGRRHIDPIQEEVFVVIDGTLTIHMGEGDEPERHELERGSVLIVQPGTALQLSNTHDEELRFFAVGAPPERGETMFLPDGRVARARRAVGLPGGYGSARKRAIRSAISSPLSSWRKCPAPATISAGSAPGMCAAMRSAWAGEKTRSESENRTSAGFSQRDSAVAHLEHRRRGRVVELRRDELGERERAGLGLADGERRVVAADRVLVERGDARDLHQAARREVGPDLTDELAEAEPVRRGRAAGADARVEDHEPLDAVGMRHGEAEPDRASPVVDDQGEPREVELEREALDRAVVRVVRVVGLRQGLVRAAEAEEVGDDHPPDAREHRDRLPVEEPPGRLTVQEEHRVARALLDVVHPEAVLRHVARRVGPAAKVVEALVGRAVGVHGATLRLGSDP